MLGAILITTTVICILREDTKISSLRILPEPGATQSCKDAQAILAAEAVVSGPESSKTDPRVKTIDLSIAFT